MRIDTKLVGVFLRYLATGAGIGGIIATAYYRDPIAVVSALGSASIIIYSWFWQIEAAYAADARKEAIAVARSAESLMARSYKQHQYEVEQRLIGYAEAAGAARAALEVIETAREARRVKRRIARAEAKGKTHDVITLGS